MCSAHPPGSIVPQGGHDEGGQNDARIAVGALLVSVVLGGSLGAAPTGYVARSRRKSRCRSDGRDGLHRRAAPGRRIARALVRTNGDASRSFARAAARAIRGGAATGAPADDQTVAAVTATIHEIFACFDAAQYARAFALMTDDAAREFGPDVSDPAEDTPEEVRTTLEAQISGTPTANEETVPSERADRPFRRP